MAVEVFRQNAQFQQNTQRRMPAEWEEHQATWIAWPHEPTDWPGKLEPIHWVYAEIVRALSKSEPVEILCTDQQTKTLAEKCLQSHRVPAAGFRLHVVPNDRGWLRDSVPSGVKQSDGSAAWVQWKFRAWAKYDNYLRDAGIPAAVSALTARPLLAALRPDNNEAVTLEGGAIEVDGQGTLLTTEECLLSDIQQRNPGLSRQGYEEIFSRYLGVTKTIWLGKGCVGDDTHGHIDDIARFTSAGKVVLSFEEDPADENHQACVDNYRRLQEARDAHGRNLEVIKLPMPEPIWFGDERLPASYANFYIANTVVLVPTFNDANDRHALNILAELFPSRKVIGIHAVDLVLGQGTLHCLSQQQPK
jgi:agmatine deiminase